MTAEQAHLQANEKLPPATKDGNVQTIETDTSQKRLDQKQSGDADLVEVPVSLAPDGGWGWAVVVASFCGNLIVDGLCYTYGIIYNELLEYFEGGKGTTALVGALLTAMYSISGPFVGTLCNKFGCRIVAMTGSLIAAGAFILSTFCTSIEVMLFVYGLIGGIGLGLLYLPCVVMPGHYFDKKRALATGIAVCGSGFGTFVMAPLASFFVREYGWKGANILLAGCILQGCVAGAIMRPVKHCRRRIDKVPQKALKAENDLAIKESIEQISNNGADRRNTEKPIEKSTRAVAASTPDCSVASLGHSTASLRIKAAGSHQSLNKMSKQLTAPFARKDVLYTGSVTNLDEYKSAQDVGEFVASVTNINALENSSGNTSSRLKRFFWLTLEMFDLRLFRSLTFICVCLAGAFVFWGLYTPYVYVQERALKELGCTKIEASNIIMFIGIFSTSARPIIGWIADRKWLGLVIIHNLTAIAAGVATMFVPLMNSYVMLVIYGSFFGGSIACFIALRSIVVVELMSVDKLNNAFGIVVMFQGVAVLLGSPISGALVDSTGSYVAPFLVFGVLIALGGVVCLPVRRIARWERDRELKKLGKLDNNNAVNA